MQPTFCPKWAFLAALLALANSSAHAAVHDVMADNDGFIPAHLTIQVGDTVRWTNPLSPTPSTRIGHNVTSNDGLWAEFPASENWVFEYTFTEEGVFNYYCTPHAQLGMTGSVTVESGGASQGVNINAGMNDAWYDPSTPGQGFFFNVFPELGLMFIAWFTYDVNRPPGNVTATVGEPGHRWVTGLGAYAGDTANISLERTQGGVFDSGTPAVTQTADYGSLDLEFHDCSTATATYSIPSAGVSGTISLQRIVGDNVPLCESLASGGGAAQ